MAAAAALVRLPYRRGETRCDWVRGAVQISNFVSVPAASCKVTLKAAKSSGYDGQDALRVSLQTFGNLVVLGEVPLSQLSASFTELSWGVPSAFQGAPCLLWLEQRHQGGQEARVYIDDIIIKTMSYHWSVSDTGDGDGIVEPGESALVTMWAAMSPGRTGFAGSIYDILGGSNWTTGTVVSYDNRLDALTDDGQLQNNGDILHIEGFQLPPAFNVGFDASNPIPLYSITWNPNGDYRASGVSR